MEERLMEERFEELKKFAEELITHGGQLVIGLIILLLGLFLTKWVMRYLRENLSKWIKTPATVSVIVNSVGVLLFNTIIAATLIEIGANPANTIALLTFIVVGAIAVVAIFRPLLPTLPFKVGNVVKAAGLLGKIEATTILNTRMRTFDGKTFFVPNRTILNDVVINYHFTKTRRVKIDVVIGYDQDLIRAKQVLEMIMVGDARVLNKPSPQIYIMEFTPSGIAIGARCWVSNIKYWPTRCDLNEKVIYKFALEKIAFAHTQMDIYHHESLHSSENDMEDESIYNFESQKTQLQDKE
jgi:small conductance mechanosensitive channel